MRHFILAVVLGLMGCAGTPDPEPPSAWLQLERFIDDRQDCWIWIEPDTSYRGMINGSTPVSGNLAPSGVDALRTMFSDQMNAQYKVDALPVTDENLQSGTKDVPIFRIIVRDEQLRLSNPRASVRMEALFRTSGAGEQTSEMLRNVTDIVDHIVDRVVHGGDTSKAGP